MLVFDRGLVEVDVKLVQVYVLGIFLVLIFVIDGKWVIFGVQLFEVFVNVLCQIVVEQGVLVVVVGDEVCGLDGCKV